MMVIVITTEVGDMRDEGIAAGIVAVMMTGIVADAATVIIAVMTDLIA